MNSRRNFIKSITRTMIAGALIGTSGYLIFREPSGETCNFEFPCNNCKKLAACNEQKARDFKTLKNTETGGKK